MALDMCITHVFLSLYHLNPHSVLTTTCKLRDKNVLSSSSYQCFPWWLNGRESACQCRKHRFDPWVRNIPWRRKWQLTPVFLPGKSHRVSSLVDYSQTKLWLNNQKSNNIFIPPLMTNFLCNIPMVMYGCESWTIKKAE